MKNPTCNIGEWSIKYKQVPYDDRYFTIQHKKEKLEYTFNAAAYGNLLDTILPLALRYDMSADPNHWGRFLERVEKYNRWLDERD